MIINLKLLLIIILRMVFLFMAEYAGETLG